MVDCSLCYDCGILGGSDVPYRFCGCPTGKKKQLDEPEAVNLANKVRDDLMKRFPPHLKRLERTA